MLIDLVDRLISRMIDLVKERRSARRETFDNIVAPIFSEFEKIHELYLNAFRQYRDWLRNEDCALEEQILRIHEERLFGEHKRSRLRALVSATGTVSKDELTQQLCYSIYRYLTLTHSDDWWAHDDPAFPEQVRSMRNTGVQRWTRQYMDVLQYLASAPNERMTMRIWGRWLPIHMLVALKNGERGSSGGNPLISTPREIRFAAIQLLDGLVQSMQDEFQRIAGVYAHLQNQLT